jgi:muconolactone delta-isomerase
MEYLVTMTTVVPDGTSEAAVEEIRTREAARSRELAAERHLLRLWRPPLAPGEWRTLGLFAASDQAALEDVLASMPLRVWRTDEVTSLSPHSNDPRRAETEIGGTEYFITFTVRVPEGTPQPVVEREFAREATRARELAGDGYLKRLWMLSSSEGVSRSLGLWRARDEAEIQAIVDSLPLLPWMSVETTPLTAHPSDPAGAAAESRPQHTNGGQ